MSEDYLTDTLEWCEFHTVARSACGCAFGPQPSRLQSALLDRTELGALPKPEPLIADTLDRRTVALLAGYWGTGKSFFAQDWAASIATGRRWQGRDTNHGRVLFIASEGAYGLDGRLTTWEYAWGLSIATGTFNVLPVPVQVTNATDLRNLLHIVSDLGVDFVGIDTVARCAIGLDENSSRDMGLFVDALFKIRDATVNGTVLAVHHTGKDRTTVRGSSALEAGVDTVYQVEGDAGLLKLQRTKRKDGPTPDVHQLQLVRVGGQDSVVLQSTGGAWTSPSAETILSTFQSTFTATGATTANLRDVLATMPKSTFYKGLNMLVGQGLLVNRGSEKQPFYRLAASDDQ